MKNLFKYTAVLLAGLMMLGASSCKDDNPIPDRIKVTPVSLNFSWKDPENKPLVYVYYADEWRATCPDSWVKIDELEDKAQITVDNNETGKPRGARITFTSSNGTTATVAVTQYHIAPPSIDVTPRKLLFDATKNPEKKLEIVATNTDWTIEADKDWIDVNKEGTLGKIAVVNVDDNDGTEKRYGTVTVTATFGDLEPVIITIEQFGLPE